MQAAADAAYAEYESHMAKIRVKGSEIIDEAAVRASASSCWQAAPTMWTPR